YGEITSIQRSLNHTLGRDKSVFRVGAFPSALSPNTEMFMGYQTVGGYTALFLHRYYEYINYYSEEALPRQWQVLFYGRERRAILMDLLNVKYELSHDARQALFRKSCLPRAFIVPNSVVKEKEEILPLLTSPGFDPQRAVFFEPSAFSFVVHPSPSPGFSRSDSAQVVSYRPDRIQVRVSCPSPGYLFLSENYYPGWKAFVDKGPVPILRGNYLFRVVPVPEGEHLVEVIFQPWSIRLGIAVTLLTLCCLAVYFLSLLTNLFLPPKTITSRQRKSVAREMAAPSRKGQETNRMTTS
ncbi:MAG: YfhO family protein, partial [Deltaproteobacteria bacterium]|nr:YfhO family protein [Deltaproteobacteria bacterium]